MEVNRVMSNPEADDWVERAPPTKRCRDDSEKCIVHIPGLTYGPLVLLSATKDPAARLARLKEVRDETGPAP